MLFNHQFLVERCSSISTTNSSSRASQYTSERIKFLLNQQPPTYIVIKSEKTNSSLCWKVFGFLAKKLENVLINMNKLKALQVVNHAFRHMLLQQDWY